MPRKHKPLILTLNGRGEASYSTLSNSINQLHLAIEAYYGDGWMIIEDIKYSTVAGRVAKDGVYSADLTVTNKKGHNLPLILTLKQALIVEGLQPNSFSNE